MLRTGLFLAPTRIPDRLAEMRLPGKELKK
jgi:hypothetical protein